MAFQVADLSIELVEALVPLMLRIKFSGPASELLAELANHLGANEALWGCLGRGQGD